MKDITTEEAVQTLKDFAKYGRYYSVNTEHHMKSSINKVLDELEKKNNQIEKHKPLKEVIIKRLVENALKKLESVDYTSNVKQIQKANNKKVQGAYNILFDLNRKLKEENSNG